MTQPVEERAPEFNVRLANFEGPFDLLLQLISRHRLDITEIALSRVTDEFVAHIRSGQAERGAGRWDLDQLSQFIVVAATLLDLKAARLLPQGEVDDPEDLALLEARDLLFARLLQYRAFKLVSGWIAETLADQGRRFARPGGLEGAFAKLLPEVRIDITADGLAWLAGGALTPKPAEEVSLAHLHQAQVSVREQAEVVMERLLRKFKQAKTLVPAPVIEATGTSDIGLVAVGSSRGAVNEARDILARRGIPIDYMRIKAFPFTRQVEAFMASHDKIFVVEQNRDAQLRSLLMPYRLHGGATAGPG